MTPYKISVQNEVVTDHPRLCQGLITSKLLLHHPNKSFERGEKKKKQEKKNKEGKTTVSQTFKKKNGKQTKHSKFKFKGTVH